MNEELDNLNNQVNQMYDEQMKQQQNIINTSTQQAIDEYERNKQKAQEEADKTNRALYTDYQKQVNPYGVNAENLYEQGLAKSGLAETTKANYYNTYQNARAEAQSNANNIKADFDAQIAKARQNGDLQLAQSALNMYQQKINDLYNIYNLNYQKQRDDLNQSNWQKEFDRAMQESQWNQNFNQQKFDYDKSINDRNYNYQVGRDNKTDEQWQQQFDYNKAINDRNYNYQLERDAITDDQWQQQFELSKKNSARSSGGSSRSYSSASSNTIDLDEGEDEVQDITIDDIVKNIQFIQGPDVKKPIYDSYSGKYFETPQDVIDYWTKNS